MCFEFLLDKAGDPVLAIGWPAGWKSHHWIAHPIERADLDRFKRIFAVVAREGIVTRSEPYGIYDEPPLCYLTTFETLDRMVGVMSP